MNSYSCGVNYNFTCSPRPVPCGIPDETRETESDLATRKPSRNFDGLTVSLEDFCRLCGPVVYSESLKREIKTKTIYGYRCDERLKTNIKESTRLASTPLYTELEHLKIETRLTSETPVSEMGEYAICAQKKSLFAAD